jgi:hypothetical protein
MSLVERPLHGGVEWLKSPLRYHGKRRQGAGWLASCLWCKVPQRPGESSDVPGYKMPTEHSAKEPASHPGARKVVLVVEYGAKTADSAELSVYPH